MFKILGLSHLVFTVNCEKLCSLDDTLLGRYYGNGEYFEFDHSISRRELIRIENNLISKISLFKALKGDLPAIEFLYSSSKFTRPSNSFGLIINNIVPPISYLKKELVIGKDKSINYVLDEKLGLNVAYSTKLIGEDFGCWIIVSDFDEQKHFLISEKSNFVISNEEDLLIIKCRVINSSLSYFTIVLIREKNNLDLKYYNDDLGLSTIGWFQKKFDYTTSSENFLSTHPFQISIFEKTFDAKFLYNNTSISHELLNIK